MLGCWDVYNARVMTENGLTAEMLFALLIDTVESTLRNLDSALTVAHHLHDWKRQYRELSHDPPHGEQIDAIVAMFQEMARAVLAGEGNDQEMYARLEQLRKALQRLPQ